MKFHLVLLCVVLVSVSLPAIAAEYLIQAEEIISSSDWALKTLDTDLPADAVAATGASNGEALRVVDNVQVNLDPHTPGNNGDLIYTTTAVGGLGSSATAVFRMRTTSDQEFSPLSGSPADDGWERNIILSFSGGGAFRKCVGFAVRPDGAAITNTTATSVYPAYPVGVVSVDNTTWHTWTIVARNFTSGGGSADVYLDGLKVIDNVTLNLTTDTAIGYIDGLSVAAAIAGTSRDGLGCWEFDWVAYKSGEDPTWPGIPEPGSLVALASGLAALCGVAFRRRSA